MPLLDVDRVTKRFYDRFKTEHTTFRKRITGISDTADRAWYASLLLHRLMFLYFIQKKGFLAGEPDYLRRRLQMVRETKGQFSSFYRSFLRRFFHEGLGQSTAQRTKDLQALLGDVPYLNGGLFDVHALEHANPDIQIADEAFAQLFDFFDAYQWHLDERPLRADNAINPDVLGHIFEKHINQKQMGAYYTKEDITGYIARNTVIPFLFDAAEQRCPSAFRPDAAVWRLLRDDPDRYIYPAVRQGVDRPLLPEITAGVGDVAQRQGWNKPAGSGFALPTETWREHVARRRRCHELRAKLKVGDVHSINDLVTCNLDIGQFAEDAITSCAEPELLRAFYQAIEKVSVLDPACGSGAFLFAALSILEPLYAACLDGMQAFVDARQRFGTRQPEQIADFRAILDEAARHPNRRCFILKSIISHNLFGVDIMEEAVEICKLRLFLKLLARVETVQHLEPLPDIAFNIRPGNSLVGFTPLDLGSASTAALPRRLEKLRVELDRHLAGAYAVKHGRPEQLRKWRASHRPFHWFAEFHGIMQDGGFDVVIGNPPYVEYRKVRDDYRIEPCRYETEPAQNLYAFFVERSGALLRRRGRFGMIIPSSAVGLDETACLRSVLCKRYGVLHCSTYSIRPARLFEGVDQRLCILLAAGAGSPHRSLFTTRYHHWHAEERAHLFATLTYVPSHLHPRLQRIAQVGDPDALRVLARIEQQSAHVVRNYRAPVETGFLAHFHRSPRYWIRALDFEQYFQSRARSRSIHHFRDLWLTHEEAGKAIGAVLNSTLFFFWFMTICNGRNLTNADVASFPIGRFDPRVSHRLGKVFAELMTDYQLHSFVRKRADCEYQEFRPNLSKPVIDKIDAALAKHYGFTDEELDFIVNYEIKYRCTAR